MEETLQDMGDYEWPEPDEIDNYTIRYIPGFDSKLSRLEDDDPIRAQVINTFRQGLGPLSPDHIDVFTVYQNQLLNPIQDFLIFDRVGFNLGPYTKGSQSVEFAFCGGSKQDLLDIIEVGFYGKGSIVLSKPQFCSQSVFMSTPDADGVFHVLMCKVHKGRTHLIDKEVVEDAIEQRPPVDYDIAETRREFVVYDCHKNSHVLPLYIISFGGASFRAAHAEVHGLLCHPETRTPMNILSALVNVLALMETGLRPTLESMMDNYENNNSSAAGVIQLMRALPCFNVIRGIFDAYFLPMLKNCLCISFESVDLQNALATISQQGPGH